MNFFFAKFKENLEEKNHSRPNFINYYRFATVSHGYKGYFPLYNRDYKETDFDDIFNKIYIACDIFKEIVSKMPYSCEIL